MKVVDRQYPGHGLFERFAKAEEALSNSLKALNDARRELESLSLQAVLLRHTLTSPEAQRDALKLPWASVKPQLSLRAEKALRRVILTPIDAVVLADVAVLTPGKLYSQTRCGKKTVAEISGLLVDHGLELGMSVDPEIYRAGADPR